MNLNASVEYLSVGGNRHPSAADFDTASGLVCYGAGQNLALWSLKKSSGPIIQGKSGITRIVNAHQDTVNAVQFVRTASDSLTILSGSADRTIRVWQSTTRQVEDLKCVDVVKEHNGSINCFSTSEHHDFIASGATDGTVKIWRLQHVGPTVTLEHFQTLDLRPNYLPLALALHPLSSSSSLVLAIGGTRSDIDVYIGKNSNGSPDFTWQTCLTGHDGWIRSLDFVYDSSSCNSDILLASASQDKYIRLWRIQKENENDYEAERPLVAETLPFLSNKTHRVCSNTGTFAITFEALLLGHEDWIYSVRWNQNCGIPRLLSASADNSVVIWESELASGIWICKDRFGEVSAQKGSTTATGSTGGFWIALWANKGLSVVSLGRTGSWRQWSYHGDIGGWMQEDAVTGHIRDVRDLAWSHSGAYLLSSSADQTTRIHALRKTAEKSHWCELARPQIHGYDINCVEAIGDWQFVSGADEKLLRVFDAPAPFAASLRAISGIRHENSNMPQVATVPVLGLSNKAGDPDIIGKPLRDIEPSDAEHDTQLNGDKQVEYPIHVPYEDMLSRHTLWPEREKLYGHGFEVSALAVSHDGSMIASACKASSPEHSVIRLYKTNTWQGVKPVLAGHSLTVTCLAFSENDELLLSGGRDRQWSVFERTGSCASAFSLRASNPKGHSRMILGVAWIRSYPEPGFATAGRDKSIKIWAQDGTGFTCCSTIPTEASVTSIDFCQRGEGSTVLGACGLETGAIIIYALDSVTFTVIRKHELGESISPSLSINRVKWQPDGSVEESDTTSKISTRLAIASQDNSVRIVRVLVAPVILPNRVERVFGNRQALFYRLKKA